MTDEIENILKVLESEKINHDEKSKAYRNLNTLLKDENEKDSIYYLCSFLNRFLKRFMFDITNGPDKVVHAALRALGFIIHSASIVTYYSEVQIKELVGVLVRTITNASEKGRCQLAVWCVSVQALNMQKVAIKPLVDALVYAVQSPFKSPGIEMEALNALGRLLVQVPTAMLQEITTWAPPIFSRLLLVGPTSSSSIREKAEVVWRLALPLLSPVPEELSRVVFNELTSSTSSLVSALVGLLDDQDKEVLHAVRVWGYLILALGKHLLKEDLINTLLKIPNKTFLHASTSVRIATFHNWRCLIDNFSEDMETLNARRLRLLMMPFYNGNKDPDVSARQNGFMTWTYLVSKIASGHLLENAEVFKQAVTSYLSHVVRDHEPEIYNLGFEAAGLLLNVPDKEDTEDNARALVRHSTLDIFATVQLETSLEFFTQQNGFALEFFLDVLKEGLKKPDGDSVAGSVREIWKGLVARVTSSDTGECGLLQKLFNFTRETCEQVPKYSAIIYDVLLTSDTLRKYLISSSCKMELDGQQVVPIVYLSYYWINLGNTTDTSDPAMSAFDNTSIYDEFVSGFDRILSLINASPVSALQHMQSLLELVEDNTLKFVCAERGNLVFLLTWAIIAQKVSVVVTESTADVFGKANLSNTITFVNYALVLPLKEYKISLPPHIKTAWTNLFITYHRTASMKVTDFNSHIDALLQQITQVMDSVSAENALSDLLVMAVSVILGAVDLTVQKLKQKRKHTPSPTIPSLLPLLSSLLLRLHNETNPSTPNLLRSIGKAFSCQTTPLDLECSLGTFLPALVLWIKEPKPKVADTAGSNAKDTKQSIALISVDAANYTNQVKQAVDELWQELISSIKRLTSSDQFSTELLQTVHPLLVAALSNKHRQIKNSAIQFWNETFGSTKTKLHYPSSLVPILASLREKTHIELPWFPKQTESKIEINNGTSSIPLEDQTLPPISDAPAVHSFGLKRISLSIQPDKVLKIPNNPIFEHKKRRVEPPKTNQPKHDKSAFSALSSANVVVPQQHSDIDLHPPSPVAAEDPTPPSPPTKLSTSNTSKADTDADSSNLILELQRITSALEHAPMTHQQLLLTQKHVLRLAAIINEKAISCHL